LGGREFTVNLAGGGRRNLEQDALGLLAVARVTSDGRLRTSDRNVGNDRSNSVMVVMDRHI
jgi:hypothetical protein